MCDKTILFSENALGLSPVIKLLNIYNLISFSVNVLDKLLDWFVKEILPPIIFVALETLNPVKLMSIKPNPVVSSFPSSFINLFKVTLKTILPFSL